MVSKIKRGSRRCFAVALSVLMLLSAWVFVAPESLPKAQAGNTSYKWRVYVNSRNDTGGWNSEKMVVYGKPNNGTGSETTLLTVNNWKIDFKGTRDNTFGKGDQTTSQFPTKLYYEYSFGGGASHRKLDADITLQLWNYKTSAWVNLCSMTVYSYEWGKNSGNKSMSSSGYPSTDGQYTTISGGSTSLTVPKVASGTGATVYTDPFAYTSGTITDQYGVNAVSESLERSENVIWLISKLAGVYVQAEYMTSEGRIDLVLQTPKFCYVMEFKLDGTAEEALAQIEDKHYTLPFEQNGQEIIRIGMNFSKETRNIEKVIIG